MSVPGDVVHVVGELPEAAPHPLLPLVTAGQLQTARSATRGKVTNKFRNQGKIRIKVMV